MCFIIIVINYSIYKAPFAGKKGTIKGAGYRKKKEIKLKFCQDVKSSKNKCGPYKTNLFFQTTCIQNYYYPDADLLPRSRADPDQH